jgi:ribosomal protein S20
LGITVEQLNTAFQTANQAALDQAVQKGLITQAQADELKSRGATFPFGGRWSGWLSQNGIDYQALLADALGITVDQLNAAYITAHNAAIDQAVADGRLTQEQADLMKGEYALKNNQNFQTAMKNAFEAAVKQAVTEGVITQAQADQILANQDGMGLRGFGGPGFGGDFGFGGGLGHHGGGFGRGEGWENGAPTVPSVPTTPSTPSGSSGL